MKDRVMKDRVMKDRNRLAKESGNPVLAGLDPDCRMPHYLRRWLQPV